MDMERVTTGAGGPWGAVVDGVGSVAVATAIVALLDSSTTATGLGVVYLLAVLFVAIRRSELAALATAVLSVLSLNFFFIEPRHRLTISDSENVVALVILLIAAVVVSRLAQAERNRAAEAETRAREAAAREREAELLAAAGSAVLAGANIEAQLENVGASIGAKAGASSVRVELASAPSPRPGEFELRLPTTSRPAWLYVSEDVGWNKAALNRIAGPLAKLIDVALEREKVAQQAAEAEATRRADVAKTAVLHAISHDLRSPLTGVTAAAGALRGDSLSAADRDELTSVIESEADRLARLIDDLLDLSRIQAEAVNPRTDWCDLYETAVSAGAQAQAIAGKHPIQYELPADLPLVKADPTQLERVFTNLIQNAIRYSPSDVPVRITGGVGAGSVTVRVINRGRAIPPSQRAQIFEPFFRGSDSRGSGLGLAISKGFVEANGGRIRMQTGTGEGTSFAVSFPLVPQPAAAT